MSKIKVESKCAIYDGMSITFRAPCDSAAVDGMNVYYKNEKQSFAFRDVHGNTLSGRGDLFAEGAYVKAILDTGNGYAFLQNVDISSGNEYVWEKVKMHTTITPTFSASGVYVYLITMTADADATGSLTYSDTIDLNRNLIDPKTVSFSISNYAHVSSVLANKYFFNPQETGQLLYCPGAPEIELFSEEVEEYYFNEETGEEWFDYVTKYELSIQASSGVKVVSSVSASADIDERYGYVSSPNPNAYPIDDGFTYLVRGQLGGLGRVVTGSYVGTGTFGIANKNSLTFDFQPKIVLISVGCHDQFRKGAMFMYGQTQSTIINEGGSYSTTQGHISLSWFGTGVSWYDDYHNVPGSGGEYQLNGSGLTYYYTAIG